MNRVKRVTKWLVIGVLAYLSLSMIATAPQKLTAIIFLACIWGVGYFIAKHRKYIFSFMDSDVSVPEYLEKQALLKRETNHRLQNPHLFTLDAKDMKPLTEYETNVWNRTISDFNDKKI